MLLSALVIFEVELVSRMWTTVVQYDLKLQNEYYKTSVKKIVKIMIIINCNN